MTTSKAFFRMTLDRASNRWVDRSGFLHVGNNVMTKAGVDKYFGYEIPGGDGLGLDPQKIYYVFRPPEELKKGMTTLHGLPILDEHNQDMTADSPLSELHVGVVGTSARWDDREQGILNEAVFHVKDAIKDIMNRSREDLSCGYNYDVEIAPPGSEWQGQTYDLVMRNIEFNHVALVPEGRVEGAKVADRRPKGIDASHKRLKENAEKKNNAYRRMSPYSSVKKDPPLTREERDKIREQNLAYPRKIGAIKGNDTKVDPTIPSNPFGRRRPNPQQFGKKKSSSDPNWQSSKFAQEFTEADKNRKAKGMDMAILKKQEKRVVPNAVKKPLHPKAGKGLDAAPWSKELSDKYEKSLAGTKKAVKELGGVGAPPEKWKEYNLRKQQEAEAKGAKDADYEDPKNMMAEGEENGIINAIADLVDRFRGVHKTEGVESIEQVASTEDNEIPISPTLDAEEEFVAAVRDALEGFGSVGGGAEIGTTGVEAIAKDNEESNLVTADEDIDLTGYTPEQLHGWIQKIEGELRNRSSEQPGNVDLQAGDDKNDLLAEDTENKDDTLLEEGSIVTKGKAMDARMAVDAAVRQLKAANDAKNAAIALVEPLVGSVTKLMAMDSAEEILRHTLETHGETPPVGIGLSGLHGMVGMLLKRDNRSKMAADSSPPKRAGVESMVAENISKYRERCKLLA